MSNKTKASKESINLPPAQDKSKPPAALILAFIKLSNVSTLAIVALLTFTNYLNNFYDTIIEPYLSKERFPLVVIAILTGFNVYIFPYWTLSNRIINNTFNEDYPRISQRSAQGYGLRIQSAFENFIETYPIYMTAIILARIQHLELNYQVSLSLLILIGRFIHPIAYSLNLPILRAFCFQYAQIASYYLILFSVFPEFKEFIRNKIIDILGQL